MQVAARASDSDEALSAAVCLSIFINSFVWRERPYFSGHWAKLQGDLA